MVPKFTGTKCSVFRAQAPRRSVFRAQPGRVRAGRRPPSAGRATWFRRRRRVYYFAFRRGSGSADVDLRTMSSSTTKSTVQSDAESRVITVKTEAGDIVKYSGNPAELPGARFETKKALLRSGAFSLLIKHNASRLRNGIIAVEDVDNIMFVTELVNDPDQASYSFEKPCPGTASRIAALNISRAAKGEAAYVGAGNIAGVPDKLLKLAVPNPHEVAIEALAYALTILSIFEDTQHANELLVACDYDGRKLAPLLDQIEAQASAEDVTLVTGRRDAFKEGFPQAEIDRALIMRIRNCRAI